VISIPSSCWISRPKPDSSKAIKLWVVSYLLTFSSPLIQPHYSASPHLAHADTNFLLTFSLSLSLPPSPPPSLSLYLFNFLNQFWPGKYLYLYRGDSLFPQEHWGRSWLGPEETNMETKAPRCSDHSFRRQTFISALTGSQIISRVTLDNSQGVASPWATVIGVNPNAETMTDKLEHFLSDPIGQI
jgi:hypothetical protein